MKTRDFQFIKYFLTQNDIPHDVYVSLLDYDVEILDGETDHVVKRKNSIIYHSPSSIMKFLFNTTYSLILDFVNDPIEKDKISLLLLHSCRDYVYLNLDKDRIQSPPVVCSFDKISIPAFVIKNLIEPLTGKLKKPNILFQKCDFTDACRYIPERDIILVNTNIQNDSAKFAHLTYKIIELDRGEVSATKIVKNILLDESGSVLSDLVTILKYLNKDGVFPFEFLNMLQSHATLVPKEADKFAELQYNSIKDDQRLQGIIKKAGGSYTPQVFRQWSQWSALMGLIEKQLGHMRGSFWPTTTNMKPHEDKKKEMILKVTKEKGKNQLNMEELLEVSRNWYDHNATEPGQLFEKILKEERIWN